MTRQGKLLGCGWILSSSINAYGIANPHLQSQLARTQTSKSVKVRPVMPKGTDINQCLINYLCRWLLPVFPFSDVSTVALQWSDPRSYVIYISHVDPTSSSNASSSATCTEK